MNALYASIQTHGLLVARVLIGLLFVASAVNILVSGIAGTAGMIEAKGVPMAMLFAWLVVIFKLAAGGALIFGYRTQDAALALAGFTIVATLLYHMNLQDINLFKNLAIIGGLAVVISQCAPATRTSDERSTAPSMAI